MNEMWTVYNEGQPLEYKFNGDSFILAPGYNSVTRERALHLQAHWHQMGVSIVHGQDGPAGFIPTSTPEFTLEDGSPLAVVDEQEVILPELEEGISALEELPVPPPEPEQVPVEYGEIPAPEAGQES